MDEEILLYSESVSYNFKENYVHSNFIEVYSWGLYAKEDC